MHAGTQHNRLRDRMTPMGLSVLINGCLLALMAHAFTAPNGPVRRYLEVELQVPAAAIRHVTKPQIKQAVLPAPAPRPVMQPRVERQTTSKPTAQTKPVSAVLGLKQELRSRPGQTQGTRISGPSLALPSDGDGGYAPNAAGAGAIGGAPGPGVYAGSGQDTGEHGGGTAPGIHRTGDSSADQPAPAHEVRAAIPEPPKPAPKGESRSARISRQSRPAYPSDAREEGVEGAVLLVVSIGADGRVTSAKVDRSSGDRRLDRAAAAAVRQWSYEPSLEDGVPVASSVRVRVEFRLE